MINLLSFFGSGESSPQDLTTVDGASVWAAARAAAAAAPTPVIGDRPEAASTAAGAAGKIKTYHGPNHEAEL
jgi:hypothetical protein